MKIQRVMAEDARVFFEKAERATARGSDIAVGIRNEKVIVLLQHQRVLDGLLGVAGDRANGEAMASFIGQAWLDADGPLARDIGSRTMCMTRFVRRFPTGT